MFALYVFLNEWLPVAYTGTLKSCLFAARALQSADATIQFMCVVQPAI